jgi:hypothetical protein
MKRTTELVLGLIGSILCAFIALFIGGLIGVFHKQKVKASV